MSAKASGTLRALQDGALAGLALAAGVALSLHYGRVGFMPLDQSIVFDGAWRVLCGQLPGRDYVTPSGLVPILAQAAFFRVMGVSWLSYCVHAALANGLFVLVAGWLLRRLGASRPVAFAYAVLSAVVFYPPFGVPYMDQHAFLFGLAAVAGMVGLIQAATPKRQAWAALGIAAALTLGYLSKPIPTVLLAPLLPVAIAFAPRERRARALGQVTGMAAAMIGLVLVLAMLAGIRPWTLFEQFVLLPLRVGAPRVGASLEPWRWPAALFRVMLAWRLASVVAVHLGSLAVLAACLRRRAQGRPCGGEVWLRLVLAEGLLFVCAVFAALTKNEPENAIPYVFVSLGLTHLNLLALRRPASWLTVGMLLFALADAAAFDRRVNAPRLVAGVERSVARPAPLPPALSFMVWRDPGFYGYSAADLRALVDFLHENPGGFMLVGDTSILYGLTGRPSVNPVLWFHPRLTLPGRQTAGFRDYQEHLLANMRRAHVRFVVVEARGTFMGTRPGQFPVLVDLIQERGAPRQAFGGFEVIELRPPLP